MAAPLVGLLASVAPSIIGAISSLFPDSKAAAEAEAKLAQSLMELEAKQAEAQLAVNAAEASHRSIFVAGWRPALMWTCVTCVFYTWWIYPWLIFIILNKFPDVDVTKIPPPPAEELWVIVMGAMGLGGFRTFEKIKGVSK